FYFAVGATTPSSDDELKIAELADQLNKLVSITHSQQATLEVIVTGSTDASGSAELNMKLAQERATNLVSQLIDIGVPGYLFTFTTGTTELPENYTLGMERKVTFRTIVRTSSNKVTQ
ncbi:OmpA family protein, partial [Saccharospirillum sp. MSK14-1]|uniref:OmpA family protein n=1 Tax=Saccharospirillum sp. MSK14-1 TaxID=1897632 RepID=UPI0011B243D4